MTPIASRVDAWIIKAKMAPQEIGQFAFRPPVWISKSHLRERRTGRHRGTPPTPLVNVGLSVSTIPLFFRNPGLAQTREINGFDQVLRRAPRHNGPQAGDAGIPIVADQPARFGELGCGQFHLAPESI